MTTPNTETQKLSDDRRAAEAHAAKHGGPDGSISVWEVEAFLAGIEHARQRPAPPSRERRSPPMESKHPPRVRIKFAQIENYYGKDYGGRIVLEAHVDPIWSRELEWPEYLSLSEANALAEEREARARKKLFEEVKERLLSMNFALAAVVVEQLEQAQAAAEKEPGNG